MGIKETKKPFSARRKQYFYRGIMNAKRYFTKLQLFLAHAILRTSKKHQNPFWTSVLIIVIAVNLIKQT